MIEFFLGRFSLAIIVTRAVKPFASVQIFLVPMTGSAMPPTNAITPTIGSSGLATRSFSAVFRVLPLNVTGPSFGTTWAAPASAETRREESSAVVFH
jgi:hypothetical protein